MRTVGVGIDGLSVVTYNHGDTPTELIAPDKLCSLSVFGILSRQSTSYVSNFYDVLKTSPFRHLCICVKQNLFELSPHATLAKVSQSLNKLIPASFITKKKWNCFSITDLCEYCNLYPCEMQGHPCHRESDTSIYGCRRNTFRWFLFYLQSYLCLQQSRSKNFVTKIHVTIATHFFARFKRAPKSFEAHLDQCGFQHHSTARFVVR